ncbi:nuclear distribution protein nudE-like 1-A isoform X1 [Schistocerca americana]|nr:nuclear distribution protein nudE-like 1-A isoform X1 [Schistocerca americana]XP_049775788.1 nuclear distribution protein nudE-like 1-A isoform X1 [Schistocerca cancellata]XP_049951240.1 nuclear distribution protein nudE-like 1-A isoform X1 [Schistocerca serialis cubense]
MSDAMCDAMEQRDAIDNSEDIDFLKNVIHQLRQELEESRQDVQRVEHDFEDFQENSRQLEKELETALDQSEKTNREREALCNRWQIENERLRDRIDQLQRQCDSKDTQLSKLEAHKQELMKRTRELEQRNDDLERALRAMSMSKGETELKLNAQIERDALLECEHEELLAMVQRLKDEKRDLTHELKARERIGPVFDNDKSVFPGSPLDSNRLKVEMQTQTTAVQGSPLKMAQTVGNQTTVTPLAPSNRILGMNMVHDLLRNIGSIESKLTASRNIARDNIHLSDATNREPYRGRRIGRTATPASPSIHSYLRA